MITSRTNDVGRQVVAESCQGRDGMKYLRQLVARADQVRRLGESSYAISILERYTKGFNSWSLGSPIPARPIWDTALFECSVLAEASYFLAAHGFYEQACALLRGLLDGFLVRLHWDTLHKRGKLKQWTEAGRTTNNYWEWESGRARTYPTLRNIWRTVLGEDRVRRYDELYGLRSEVDEELATLSRFVHGRPRTRHYPGASRSSLCNIEFRKQHFDEWYGHLRTTYCLVSVLSVLQYPDLLGTPGGKEFTALESEVAARMASTLGLASAHEAGQGDSGSV